MPKILEQLANRVPTLSNDFAKLADLYDRKLWHQLTIELEALMARPEMEQDDLLLQLYTHFICDFALRINLLKFAQIAVRVSKKSSSPHDALALLSSAMLRLSEDKSGLNIHAPLTFLNMSIAETHLYTDAPDGALLCKKLVDQATDWLATTAGQDAPPLVHAAVYHTAAAMHKQAAQYADFFHSSMLFLSYSDLATLPADYQLAIAVDIGLAALLGENVYGLNAFLLHPIAMQLESSGTYKWLFDLLKAVGAGDLHQYDASCALYATQLASQPALAAASKTTLRRKCSVLSLLELVRNLPAEARRVTLEEIASRAKLSRDGAELLVMRCLADELMEGYMDEMEGVVHVKWVQPRILNKAQVGQMKEWMDGWASKVRTTTLMMEERALGL